MVDAKLNADVYAAPPSKLELCAGLRFDPTSCELTARSLSSCSACRQLQASSTQTVFPAAELVDSIPASDLDPSGTDVGLVRDIAGTKRLELRQAQSEVESAKREMQRAAQFSKTK